MLSCQEGKASSTSRTCASLEQAHLEALQQQMELGGLLQLLDRGRRRRQRRAGDDRSVIGQQHGAMALGVVADGVGELGVARLEVGHQRQLADPHHEVGRDRRQRGLLVVVARRVEAGDRHGVRAMKMHDGAVLGPHVVDRAMQQRLLGRRIAGHVLA